MKANLPLPASQADCSFSQSAVAYVAGEVTPPEFATHLATCACCQQAVETTGRLLHRLRSAPQPTPSDALAEKILAAIQQPEAKILRPRFHRWAAAAAIVIGLTATGTWLAQDRTKETARTSTLAVSADTSLHQALDWFCRTQEPDGSWSAARWGGDPRFEVSLTALPLLALLAADVEMTPERAAAVAKAQQRLEAVRGINGSFGPEFSGSAYNQAIATLAMLQAYKRQPDDAAKRALDNSLAVIAAQQSAESSWGAGGDAPPNLSITLWQIEALKMAVSLGWGELQTHLVRSTAWVASQAPASATPPQGQPDVAGLDFFNAYFATSALKESQDETSRQRLASIRHTLLQRQVQEGTNSGSWPPDDRWGRVGGRLYTTALASLSLE